MKKTYDILIAGGTLFDMVDEPRPADLALSDGQIAEILTPGTDVSATYTFDATGKFVTPGFVDSHMHDECFTDCDTIEKALVAQGVTTGIAGQCGSGPVFGEALAQRPAPWLNLAYLTGNCALRHAAGHEDRYTPATDAERKTMRDLLRVSLAAGSPGMSLGLEYEPGASYEEVSELAAIVDEHDGIVAVHLRYDDHRCLDSVGEVISLARDFGVRVVVSHLGSITFGYTQQCIGRIMKAREEGLDVYFDCYPYDAFCTNAGSAVFDDGFEQRWRGKGPENLVPASGRFKGRRLTKETLAEMRREEPRGLIVAHVMDRAEIEACLRHPECIIASDAFYEAGGAHPRAAGTFPRALRILREGGYGWNEALRKVTAMPADEYRLAAGRLIPGRAADVIVFDPETFSDRSTFEEPLRPAAGLELTVINGVVVFEKGEFKKPGGRLLAKNRPKE